MSSILTMKCETFIAGAGVDEHGVVGALVKAPWALARALDRTTLQWCKEVGEPYVIASAGTLGLLLH